MTPARPTYTARGPLDLVALAPFLIGFHPADSVVLLTFGGAEPFHARIDLPATGDEEDALAGMLRGVVARQRVPQVALLFYSDDAEVARSLADGLLAGFEDDGVIVIDLIRVEEDAFYDALDPLAVGTPYDLSVHPFTASRVLEGQVALDSREQLADTLVGTDLEAIAAVHLAATRYAEHVGDLLARGTRPTDWAAEEAGWIRRVLGDRTDPLPPHDLGRLLVLLQSLELRDVAWATLTQDAAREQVAAWRDIVRRVPEEFLAAPAALLAFAAWLSGDGALAWCAIDRCLESDPDYSMARGLGRLLQHGVPPSSWRDITDEELDALQAPHRRSA